MPDGNDNSLVCVGKITSVWGIKGWVKVFSYTDPKENLFEYGPWLLRRNGKTRPAKLTGWRKQGKGMVAQVDDCADRDLAAELVNSEILADRSVLPELDPGEFYWSQLTGLEVVNTKGEKLGRVDHLIETGANDVLVVRKSENSIDSQERLIPYIDQVVRKVDLELGTIEVEWESDF